MKRSLLNSRSENETVYLPSLKRKPILESSKGYIARANHLVDRAQLPDSEHSKELLHKALLYLASCLVRCHFNTVGQLAVRVRIAEIQLYHLGYTKEALRSIQTAENLITQISKSPEKYKSVLDYLKLICMQKLNLAKEPDGLPLDLPTSDCMGVSCTLSKQMKEKYKVAESNAAISGLDPIVQGLKMSRSDFTPSAEQTNTTTALYLKLCSLRSSILNAREMEYSDEELSKNLEFLEDHENVLQLKILYCYLLFMKNFNNRKGAHACLQVMNTLNERNRNELEASEELLSAKFENVSIRLTVSDLPSRHYCKGLYGIACSLYHLRYGLSIDPLEFQQQEMGFRADRGTCSVQSRSCSMKANLKRMALIEQLISADKLVQSGDYKTLLNESIDIQPQLMAYPALRAWNTLHQAICYQQAGLSAGKKLLFAIGLIKNIPRASELLDMLKLSLHIDEFMFSKGTSYQLRNALVSLMQETTNSQVGIIASCLLLQISATLSSKDLVEEAEHNLSQFHQEAQNISSSQSLLVDLCLVIYGKSDMEILKRLEGYAECIDSKTVDSIPWHPLLCSMVFALVSRYFQSHEWKENNPRSTILAIEQKHAHALEMKKKFLVRFNDSVREIKSQLV